jgi:hypothetical protein
MNLVPTGLRAPPQQHKQVVQYKKIIWSKIYFWLYNPLHIGKIFWHTTVGLHSIWRGIRTKFNTLTSILCHTEEISNKTWSWKLWDGMKYQGILE